MTAQGLQSIRNKYRSVFLGFLTWCTEKTFTLCLSEDVTRKPTCRDQTMFFSTFYFMVTALIYVKGFLCLNWGCQRFRNIKMNYFISLESQNTLIKNYLQTLYCNFVQLIQIWSVIWWKEQFSYFRVGFSREVNILPAACSAFCWKTKAEAVWSFEIMILFSKLFT